MIRFAILLFCFSINVQTFACSEQEAKIYLKNIKWLTEDYPPYNYLDAHGKLTGISTDILLLAYQELGLALDSKAILIVPWARLYYNLQNHTDYAAFSMVYTAERDKLFNFVAMPITTKISIMVLNERKQNLALKNVEELTVAVVRQDIGHQLLEKFNFPVQKVVTTSANSMLQMLIRKRVDAIAYAEEVAYFQFGKLADHQLSSLYVLEENTVYNYVFNNETPACVTDLLNSALVQLEEKGELQGLRNKYLRY